MAHPMNEHRADKVMKDRVGKITKGYADGGGIRDDGMPMPRAKGGVVKAPARMTGGPVKARADKVSRAKGGRVHKGGKGNHVNVIIAPSGQKPTMMPPAPPMAAGPPPMPPKPPMGAPPPGAVGPVAGVGGMPPMPPRADGGRAYKKGGAVKAKMSGEKKHGKHEKPFKMRADGGSLKRQNEDAARQTREILERRGIVTPAKADGGDVSWDKDSGRGMLEDRKYAGMRHETGNYTGPKRASGGAVSDSSRGGTKVQHSGNKSDTQNIGRGPVITRATGGQIYSDGKKGKQMAWLKGEGAGGGKGRLAKAKREGGHEPWLKDAAS